jgi:hypothetical protein
MDGMIEHEVTRTLVKSQPEIWTQCSEADSLGWHLNGSFGEIRITRLEPEHAVAWEAELVSGTVRIEPSAWGTRVTMTVQMEREEVQSGSVAEQEEEVPDGSTAGQDEEEVSNGSVAGSEGVLPLASPEEPVPEAERETPPPQPIPVVELSSAPTTLLARLRARLRRVTRRPGSEPELLRPAEPLERRPPGPPVEQAERSQPVTPEPELLVTGEPEQPVTREPEPPRPAATETQPAQPEAGEHPPPGADATVALNAALESLGKAHHRPYSRA